MEIHDDSGPKEKPTQAFVYLQGGVEREVTVEEVAHKILDGRWYFCECGQHALVGNYGDREVFVYHKTL
jgi:hypothetical protein